MPNQMDITNVVNVSVSASPRGLGKYNVNNIGLFTADTPAGSFGALGYKIYLNAREVAVDFGTDSLTYKMALSVFSQSPNILNGNGYLAVIPLTVVNDIVETLEAAIIRASSLIQFFGIITTKNIDSDELSDAANYVQSINKILFTVSNLAADLLADGKFDLIRLASLTHTRCLAYLDTDFNNAAQMCAAYAGRMLSVNFSGSQTTLTPNLKDLIGILPDPTITQTQVNLAQACGADVYVSIAGVPKVLASGANEFFDEVYNLCWFIGEIEVAGFNVLATTSNKIAQTESGMSILKGAYARVCEAAIRNAYIAPGAWNSPDRFGDPEAMLRNIVEAGYYIYSLPVNLQDQPEREARIAPLVQIAIKQAGAIHKSNVLIYVNA